MSGVPGTVGRFPAPAPAGGARLAAPPGAAAAAATGPRDSLPLRLVAFAALAAFATAHWAMLVEAAPAGRLLLVLAVATGGATLLALLGRVSLPRAVAPALAALAFLGTLLLGLMAVGLPARLLLPEQWAELADGLDRGFAGVQGVDWPYDGPDEWIRRTVLMAAPALLALAAALAFWPARRGKSVLRVGGLVALLFLYGAAVAEQDPGGSLLRGLGLLLLVGAWLWLPRLPQREAGLAAAVVAGVGVLSLPVAAAVDGDRAWWDYRAWELFGRGEAITYNWTHQYGPLDWSRDGTTLLNVRSNRPHYWKAETLDGFDGLRWYRTGDLDRTRYGAELAWRAMNPGRRWDYFEYNPKWDERVRFTIRSLSTELVVGTGVTLDIDGIRATPSADGTTRLPGNERLEQGDSYTVRAYAPNPTKAQMRNAPRGYKDDLVTYTAIQLPNPGESATEGGLVESELARRRAALGRETVYVPLRDSGPGEFGSGAVDAILESPYARMYGLTQRLIEDAPTTYDAVKTVEQHLQQSYAYSERVPTRPFPLMGFLYEDKRGYCQQFSGAMALMLRMAGIPARVAAGFAPGSYNKDSREYRVRDLDAHSWVEVWFTGIGWVPFDPTPARSPAQSQSSALATSAAAADAGEVRQSRGGVAASERGTDTGASVGSDGGGMLPPALLLALVAAPLGAAAAVLVLRMRRLRSLTPAEQADLQLSELRRALVDLGWELPASTTLRGLERRLGRTAGPASERYAAALRAHRYDPRAPAAPALGARRAVRRELTRGGLVSRLRGLVAMPPRVPRG